MSDSVQPHRWQPPRLPHPCDSPGKNSGVGCHFLLQCMKVKSKSEVAQSCPTLSDPMDCSLLGSSVHGIFQARVLEWAAIALPTALLRHNQHMKNVVLLYTFKVCNWFFLRYMYTLKILTTVRILSLSITFRKFSCASL